MPVATAAVCCRWLLLPLFKLGNGLATGTKKPRHGQQLCLAGHAFSEHEKVTASTTAWGCLAAAVSCFDGLLLAAPAYCICVPAASMLPDA